MSDARYTKDEVDDRVTEAISDVSAEICRILQGSPYLLSMMAIVDQAIINTEGKR